MKSNMCMIDNDLNTILPMDISIERGVQRKFYDTIIKSWTDSIEDGAKDQILRACMGLPITEIRILPDVHQGYTVPIGSLCISKKVIIPELLGPDVGCGISVRKLGKKITDMSRKDLGRLFDFLSNPNTFPREVRQGSLGRLSLSDYISGLVRLYSGILGLDENKVFRAIGTIGGGNHFVEIGVDDETGELYSTVHSGSRFVGAWVQSKIKDRSEKFKKSFDELSTYFNSMFAEAAAFPDYTGSTAEPLRKSLDDMANYSNSQPVLALLETAQMFAKDNRKVIQNSIYDFVNPGGVPREEDIDCGHNVVFQVEPDIYCHCKGVARIEGIYGVIAGSQTDGVYIVEKTPENDLDICSHGAGRVLSRTAARNTLNEDEEKAKLDAAVPYNTFSGKSSLEECSSAYKNIEHVLSLQKDLVRPVRHIRPIMNIKG